MDDELLDAVEHHWGEAYEITRDADGRCRAVRRDGILVAPDPERLNRLISATTGRDP